MLRHLLSLLVGATCTAVVFMALVVPSVRKNWRAQGFNEGSISSSWDIAEKLAKEFPGKPIGCGNGRTLFEVKSTSVSIHDCEQGKRIHVAK
jgi:hypothetical protein